MRSHHLGRRFVGISAFATLLALLSLGVPTAVIPNPLFTRMTPIEPFNVAVWLASAPLMGLIVASYFTGRGGPTRHLAAHDGGSLRTTVGGMAAFLAIGCPVCNKLVVAVLGVSGALNVFAPLQPLIGAASVGLLAVTFGWRLRTITTDCPRCARIAAPVAPLQ